MYTLILNFLFSAMITVIDLAIPAHLQILHKSLLILELVLILPGLLIVIVTAYVMFYRVPQFHPHVHMLLSSTFIAYFVITLSRLAIVVLFFTQTNMAFEIAQSHYFTILLDGLRSAAASAVLMSAPVLSFERAWATHRIKLYEKERHPILILATVIFSWVFCCTNAYLIIIVGIDLVIFTSFGFFWLFLNYLAFQRLVSWSQSEYDRQILHSHRPLTIRFQLSENVRIGKIFLITVRAFCIGVFLALVLAVLVTKVAIPYNFPTFTLLLYHLYELVIAVATVLVGLTLIHADPRWKKEFRRIMLRALTCGRKNVIHHTERPPPSVFSLGGDQLVVQQDAEGTTYFSNLRNQWR